MLRQAVRLYGDRSWQQVAACMVNRTGQQCLHRWTKSLNPTIRSGRWTKEEDEVSDVIPRIMDTPLGS